MHAPAAPAQTAPPAPSACPPPPSWPLAQVEVTKHTSADPGPSGGGQPGEARPSPSIVRSCIARLPPGYARLEVDALQDDAIWGVDGFDT